MKTILAAIDFSPVSQRVVSEAVALARAGQARLILLNVTHPESLVRDYAALEAVVEGPDPQLEEKYGAARTSAIHGDSLQIIGEPIDVILKQAARCSADLIVMGSHGHTALFERVVGGTTAGVLRRATCPVVLVPAVRRRGLTGSRRPLRPKHSVAWLERIGKRNTLLPTRCR